jgi:hypothetical protein
MPDYEIRVWDEHSFDFNSVPFVRDAYKAKKWAFVADYVRLYALYTEGGIYLDSDVKTYKHFDDFLDNEFFIGTEPLGQKDNEVELESAIMGSVPFHPYVKECMDFYLGLDYNKRITCPMAMSRVLEKYGYDYYNRNQTLSNGVRIYDRTYFGHCFGTAPGDYYAIHYFNASWLEMPHGKLYNWCKSNDYIDYYLFLQKIAMALKALKSDFTNFFIYK